MSEEQVKPKTAEEILHEEFTNSKPEEAAAGMYNILIHQFNAQLAHLSKKGAIRVLEAMVKVPFEDMQRVLSKQEKNLYAIADRLMQCKFIMQAAIVQEELDKQQAGNEKDGITTNTT